MYILYTHTHTHIIYNVFMCVYNIYKSDFSIKCNFILFNKKVIMENSKVMLMILLYYIIQK